MRSDEIGELPHWRRTETARMLEQGELDRTVPNLATNAVTTWMSGITARALGRMPNLGPLSPVMRPVSR